MLLVGYFATRRKKSYSELEIQDFSIAANVFTSAILQSRKYRKGGDNFFLQQRKHLFVLLQPKLHHLGVHKIRKSTPLGTWHHFYRGSVGRAIRERKSVPVVVVAQIIIAIMVRNKSSNYTRGRRGGLVHRGELCRNGTGHNSVINLAYISL